ncbi:hypothetical protein NON00_22630 [Roseomonas sp. GC11]|uniref:hypothetical protein n=1 Tax=Roseomonas sp. GC11 TaxID=2950546 RepID=UPI002108E2EC|nr:hypothetical protein [Roseomonas sp. GC11]MCQ4162705.1 hypothetical protein [Roseomonas sp. GC11]
MTTQTAATGLIILPASRERELRDWASRHDVQLAFRPLEDFLPGEGTGSIVAIARDPEAQRMLAQIGDADHAAA